MLWPRKNIPDAANKASMFITLEGLDGSGKTTQVQRLIAWLQTRGQTVVSVREPGSTHIGDSVRAILHDRGNTNIDPKTELLLYCAARAQLIPEHIQPSLKAGAIVVCDRFIDSTLAYQGYGRGIELGFLRTLLAFVTGGLMPDLTFYLDVDPERALQRRSASGEEMTRLDVEAIEFHRRVRDGYRNLIAQDPARWQVIDATQTPEQIASAIQHVLGAKLGGP